MITITFDENHELKSQPSDIIIVIIMMLSVVKMRGSFCCTPQNVNNTRLEYCITSISNQSVHPTVSLPYHIRWSSTSSSGWSLQFSHSFHDENREWLDWWLSCPVVLERRETRQSHFIPSVHIFLLLPSFHSLPLNIHLRSRSELEY